MIILSATISVRFLLLPSWPVQSLVCPLVDNRIHIAETERGQGSQRARQPASLPSLGVPALGFLEDVPDGWITGDRPQVKPESFIDRIEGFLQKKKHAVAEHVSMGDDFYDLLEPGLGRRPGRRDERIKGKRGDIPSGGEDLDVFKFRPVP